MPLNKNVSIKTSLFFLLLIGILAYGTASERDAPIYSIYVSQVIRPGSDISFTISISNLPNLFRIRSQFVVGDGEIIFENVTNVLNDSTAEVVLGALPRNYEGEKKFLLTVIGENALTGNATFLETTTNFRFESKALSIFIQTDKAIYQPGEQIQFRALCLTPELTPVQGTVDYQVEDPNGNLVLQEPNSTLASGVTGGDLQLTRDSTEGKWKIRFQYQNFKEEITVQVQVYKLPKFEVELDTSSFVHPRSSGVTVSLKATYTFGQPVQGSAEVIFRLGRSTRSSVVRKSVFPFDGEENIFLSMDEIRNDLGWNGRSNQKISVFAEVTESQTSSTFNDTIQIDVVQTNIKIEVLQTPEVIKPGLLYQALIRVTEFDGSPLTNQDRQQDALILEIDYDYHTYYRPRPRPRPIPFVRFEEEALSTNETMSITTTPIITTQPTPSPGPFIVGFDILPNGIVPINIEARNDEFVSVSFRAFTNSIASLRQNHQSWTASRAQSPSDSFIQLTTVGEAAQGEVTVGSTVSVLIRTTDVIPAVRIVIIARGQILLDEHNSIDNADTKQSIYSFTVTSAMTPSLLVMASYVRDDNEVVADYVTINAAVKLANQVTIDSPLDTVEAGERLSIRVNTSSTGSFVGIRAIDQSVLLLKSGNDITTERVVKDLNKYSVKNNKIEPRRFFYWFPYSSGAKSASDVFQQAGINVLTNAVVPRTKRNVVDRIHLEPAAAQVLFAERRSFSSVVFAIDDTAAAAPPEGTRVRSLFPESWIWTKGTTGNDGSYTINVTAPDTITSWIVSAFSISDELGLGIADTYKLTVFHEFFVTLNLPLRITRGEIIIVQAVVFNYFDKDLGVAVVLHTSGKDGVQLLRPGSNNSINGPIRHVTVPAGSSTSVKYPLRIEALGEVPVSVYAFAMDSSATDAIERKVFVRPEGIQQCYSASTFIDLEESEMLLNASENLKIQIPTGIVPGSENVKLHVYGNIMESSMSNLGRLLRTPSGCGEQNMLSFAPDVFVTLYLRRIMQLDSDTQKKAYDHIRDGYMNQLNYKHKDGSFSAFGKRDKSGSTWLTAFVVKCFLFAQQLRPTLIEDKVIDQAIKFLISQQAQNGTFNEPGKVIHKEMQGNVNSPVTMTAYVLIAMIESAPARDLEMEFAIVRARNYLESQLNHTLDDPYALALMSYALQVSGSSMASEALAALNVHATVEGGMKYWHEDTADVSSFSARWLPPYLSPQTNDIEMTSYALLTYVKANDLRSAIPILKWLVSKQNDLGGYGSTQDTVLAIQALSSVAYLLTGRNQDLSITFTHSAVDTYQQRVTLIEENSDIYYTFSVPSNNGDLKIAASGFGLGVAQLSVCYNVPEDPFEEEPFNCNVEVDNADTKSANVKFCCGLEKGMEETGMFLFDIGLLNGFTVDVGKEKNRNIDAKMVELDDDSVNVYFDQLTPGGRLCANVELIRASEVAGVKPATLSAYDYYKPDKRVSFLYNVQGLSETGVCQVCGAGCAGCAAPQLTDWSSWSTCNEFCEPEMSNRTRTCYDPNLKASVHPSQCNAQSVLVERRRCPKAFNCPRYSSSLWFNLPPSFRQSFISFSCNAVRFSSARSGWPFIISRPLSNLRRSPRFGIPGILLDGLSSYVQCYHSISTYDVRIRRHVINPFTISILVRPASFAFDERASILEVGNYRDEDSNIVLQKLSRSNQTQFTVHLGQTFYRVVAIKTFPINQWSHVILTWSVDDGPNVYVNGSLAGRLEVTQASSNSSTRYPYLNFGSGFQRNSTQRGFFNGTLSAFLYWSQVLSASEIEGLSEFYRRFIDYSDEEPILSVRQLRSFLPSSLQHCITVPTTLSDLYDKAPKCVSNNLLHPFHFDF